ncbi:putative peroxidase [Medicago truncatula]|uniref:Peroxidase n=2 Tax=Medicago truncatula TaxID=3880 RepID=A0A072VNX8_MEDTR|nr:peroxidase family protein [Medicago truncatula]RHN81291.1 putative peroxidase [Medicago truncatula]
MNNYFPMAFPILFLLLISLPFSFSSAELNIDYYKQTCPDFEKIVRENIFNKQSASPATAPGLLRLFFHDCITDGCDGSVLISSTAYNPHAEKDAEINLSLSGDGYDVVNKIKNALEIACPGVVSCSDIVAQATRDLVKMVGGPFYPVALGRKDSRVSEASRTEKALPTTKMTMDDIISKFTVKNFTIKEMVALTGAHTIGFTHCKEFSDRIFNFSKTSETDPTLHPKLAKGLREVCKNYTTDPNMAAFNDVRSPGKFDNAYYQNVLKGLGLLRTDAMLGSDPRTKPIVELYARDEQAFFQDFARAMEKVSVLGVKTGTQGEVRSRCDQFNKIQG